MADSKVRCPSCKALNRVALRGRPKCGKCGEELPWIVNAGDADFSDAIDTKALVLVDLWAPWCGPCRMVAPVLEELATDHAGRLKVVKVDVDQSPATAQKYKAMSIPMLLLMKDGEVVESIVGAQPKHALEPHVLEHL